jgi:hypothetical protein
METTSETDLPERMGAEEDFCIDEKNFKCGAQRFSVSSF